MGHCQQSGSRTGDAQSDLSLIILQENLAVCSGHENATSAPRSREVLRPQPAAEAVSAPAGGPGGVPGSLLKRCLLLLLKLSLGAGLVSGSCSTAPGGCTQQATLQDQPCWHAIED